MAAWARIGRVPDAWNAIALGFDLQERELRGFGLVDGGFTLAVLLIGDPVLPL
jgi:hypothetical protein